ncbi:MAG: hypothetical protein GY754_08035 [bacterium]|nr:hypothetical protein [bacterium]
MRFNECVASIPGLLENITLDLSEKIVVISGKNSSGKSLMAKGLIDGIWRTFSNTELVSPDKWNSMYLDILFSLRPEEHYRFINNNSKSFSIRSITENHETEIYSENLENSPEDPDEAAGNKENNTIIKERFRNEALVNFLEQIDMQTFLSASFVPSPSDLEKDPAMDFKKISAIILEDNTRFYDLYKEFNNTFNDKKEDKLSLEVKKQEKMLKEFNKEIELIGIRNSRSHKLTTEKKTIKKEITALSRKLDSLTKQNHTLLTIKEDLEKIDILTSDLRIIKKEIEEEQGNINNIAGEEKEIKKLFPQFKNIGLKETFKLDKLQDIFSEIRNINEKIDSFYYLKEQRLGKLKKTAFVINIAAISAIISIFYKNNFSFKQDFILLMSLLGFPLAFTPAIFLYSFIAFRSKKLEKMKAEKESLQKKLSTLLDKSGIELIGYKLSEIYEFLLQYFEDYVEYSERIQELAVLKEGLKNKDHFKTRKKDLAELKEKEETLKKKINDNIKYLNSETNNEIIIEHNIENIDDIILSNKNEIELTGKEIDNKKNILKQIDSDLSRAVDTGDAKDVFIQKKDTTKNILEQLNSNQRTVEFIARLLTRTIEQREEKQLRKLAAEALNKFNFLTNNQFRSEIDENLVQQLIRGNSNPENIPPAVLHSLLLSVKISLSDFLTCQDLALPLIIDDPFLFMDDDRISRCKELVFQAAEQRQVIIFTLLRDKKDWGSYIEL